VFAWPAYLQIISNLCSFPRLYRTIEPLHPYSFYIYIVIRGILAFNIVVACLPLIRKGDDLSDIPLTPAQRKLLGLPPTNTPPTSGSDYVTPPRYRRSSTPNSVSPSSVYSHSPLSGKGSPALGSQASPYSPSNPSPLRHRAFGGGIADTRRSSYGTQNPLGPGTPKGSIWTEGPNTPSPSMGKGSSVPLNSKWLYEKRRGSGGDAGLFS
jgi:nucleoporin POM34